MYRTPLYLLCFIVAVGSSYAQTAEPTPTGGSQPFPTSINVPPPVDESTYPATFTTCQQVFPSTTISFDGTTGLPNGAICYAIIRTTGVVVEEPIFTVGAGTSSNSHSNKGTIAGAVVGSLLAFILLGVAFLWWRQRSIKKRRRGLSRAWMGRLNGWVDDKSTARGGQSEGRNIALQDRTSHDEVGP